MEPESSAEVGREDSGRHRRRRVPLKPRTTAKAALTEGEVRIILEVADGMPWLLREPKQGGWVEREDSAFIGRTVRVLLFTAIHISLLGFLTSGNLHRASEGGALLLQWHRTKPLKSLGGHPRLMTAVVPEKYEPWIAEYLDLPKPKDRSTYRHLLSRLAARVYETRRVSLHLNPLRFRHAGGTLYAQQFNLNQREIAGQLGTSDRVATYYTTRTPDTVLDAIVRKKGLRLD